MFVVTAYKTTYRRRRLPEIEWKVAHRQECPTAARARQQVHAFERIGFARDAIEVRLGECEVDIFDPEYDGR